ncbi:ABC transporter ATP-binding protein [Actinocrispum wychmicini]|uniref:ATP-binding cassette subfamily B protein n=1 Tax=Actinocrispum wychmicini TaxID=1213861 RepID=A0A4R2JIG4_9PSEU|nr:ABC transporter ATP-binding protein [Actinocrispum wychmicini]TCO59703.1 ATP-binding cassette subfamily B protein [Actinocrispum wychmicini]
MLPQGTGKRSAGDRLVRAVLLAGWRPTAVLVLASVTYASGMLVLPAMIATAADRQISGVGSGWVVLGLVGVLAVLVGADAVSQLATAACTANATRVLRHRLLAHVLALGLVGRARFAPGDVVNRLDGNTADTAAAGPTLSNFVSSVLLSAGGLAGLALTDWRLALTFLAGAPVGLVIVRRYVARTSHLIRRYLTVLGTTSGRLVDALGGVRTIRVSGTVAREVDRILAPASELNTVGHGMWLAIGRVSWQGGLFSATTQLAVLSVAGYEVAAGQLTPGQLLACAGYVSLAFGLLGQTSLLTTVAKVRGGAARLAEILDEPVAGPGTRALPPGPAELVLDEVTVRQDGRTVLDRVTLRVPAGHSVAVVGASGAGKSTLAAVAGRLIVPDSGRVLLDGVALGSLDPDVLRREITYAFERPGLFGTTVADAIAFGGERPSRSQVELAAAEAGADGFIRRLPAGYDTPLRDAPMSGGERQRLGLARAIAHRGRLLVLDDATSNLDTVTELQVSRVLTGTLVGRTCLLTAHRPAVAARCDLVAWLESGRIRAVAPHHELWRDAGYRAMFQPGEEPACVP